MTRLGRIGFEKRYENDQVPDQKFGQIKSAHAGPTPFDDRERLSTSAFYFQNRPAERRGRTITASRKSNPPFPSGRRMDAQDARAQPHDRLQEKTNKGLAGLRSVARSNKGYSSTYTTGRRD